MVKRCTHLLAVVVVAALSWVWPAGVAADVLDDGYQPPVAAPVADPFRLPRHFAGPGNRGIEYATRPGQAVLASGDGTVGFAGSVAGRLVLAIDHSDGLRTTYTGLSRIDVAVGERVGRGAVVGAAAAPFHFGVRAGAAYLDPARLFDASRGPARLVPIARLRAAAGGYDAALKSPARHAAPHR